MKIGKFNSQFPSEYSTVDFSNALYPPASHHHHNQRDCDPPFPRAAEPVVDEPCVREEMSQTANGEILLHV